MVAGAEGKTAAAAHCVDGCVTLRYALGEYGIDSRVEAIGLQKLLRWFIGAGGT